MELLKDVEFTEECTNIVRQTIANFDASTNPHIKWKFLKYECRKFANDFSKRKNNLAFSLLKHHESIIDKYESTTDRPSEEIYNQSKIFHDNLIETRTKGAILRSKCDWYENGEKSSKFFLNLEKRKAVNGTVKKLIQPNNSEISNSKEILAELHNFYSNLFTKNALPLASNVLIFSIR